MKKIFAGVAATAGACCSALSSAASTSATATTTTTGAPVQGALSSLALSTIAVVAVVVFAAWLLKRVAPQRYVRNNMLHVVAGTAVGQRERVVIVEIGATWLVLGVAPGNVRTLHEMPRMDTPAAAGMPAAPAPAFAQWLSQFSKNANKNQ
jgi:flagellar protein FliO/FliZ